MATWVAMAARAAMAMVSTAHVDRMMEMEAMVHKMYAALEDRETPSVRPGRRRMVVDGWSSIAHGGRPDCTAFSLRDCSDSSCCCPDCTEVRCSQTWSPWSSTPSSDGSEGSVHDDRHGVDGTHGAQERDRGDGTALRGSAGGGPAE